MLGVGTESLTFTVTHAPEKLLYAELALEEFGQIGPCTWKGPTRGQ